MNEFVICFFLYVCIRAEAYESGKLGSSDADEQPNNQQFISSITSQLGNLIGMGANVANQFGSLAGAGANQINAAGANAVSSISGITNNFGAARP